MPTYEYKCRACDHRFEAFQSMTEDPVKVCPRCGKEDVERLISAGAGLLFKGSGFYITDHRSASYKKDARNDRPTADTKPKSDTKSDPKPKSSD
ncbi:MAG TPA: zinc ribbon domain-containing protein [Acidobacteriota bacterium]|nr:zinc ribbon domain-containing protein [Acidobacteriota bacterium]